MSWYRCQRSPLFVSSQGLLGGWKGSFRMGMALARKAPLSVAMCMGVAASRALMAASSSRRVEEEAREALIPVRVMPVYGVDRRSL